MVASTSAWRRRCGSWRSKRGWRARPARRRGGGQQPPPAPPPPPQSPAAKIAQDLARRVVTRSPRHAPARMRAGAAHVEPLQRSAVVAVAEHRARAEQLIEAQGAVRDVATDEPEGALQIERTHDLTAEYRRLEVGSVGVDRVDHQIR